MSDKTTYIDLGPYGGGCFPRTPDDDGGIDWDDHQIVPRYYGKPIGGLAGGVFMSAPRYLDDFGGSSEDYDNHQWSDDINS